MIFQYAHRIVKTSQVLRCTRVAKIHTGPKQSIEDIKLFLKDYQAGSVDLIKQANGIAHLILNHPERRNALSGSMMVDMLDAVEELEKWEEGVGLVFRGAVNDSRIFCSGGDLKTVEKISGPERGFDMSILMNHTTEKLSKLPLVSVCLVDGMAVGGGAELTTTTDFRVATPGSAVAFVHARMGVAPGWGGARRLVRVVGQARALQLMLSCKKIKLEDGLDMGFFDDQVGEDNPAIAAENWLANKLKGVDPSVVRVMKSMVINEDPEQEARIFAPLWGGAANRAALEKNIKHR
eukprot:GFUD01029982.1.p1 GENE.GFUD01029982.1~~GFUD01029982.1.p1  ORF type:complete len:293 (+),score=84.77 GFUD01029982.1:119-997(+)